MKYYELTYLISSEIKEEEIKKLTEEINLFIQEEKGIIIKSGNPSPEILAYSIKKQKTAFWVSLEFYLEPEKIENLREKLKKRIEILRFLLTSKKTPKKKTIKPEIAAEKTASAQTLKEDKKEKPEKKVELKEIEKKLEEILNE